MHLLLNHAKNMYKAGLQKFPTCTALRIHYAFFLMERMSKKVEALAEFSRASQLNPTIDEEFVIKRHQKMSEDFGDFCEVVEDSVEVVSKLAYE